MCDSLPLGGIQSILERGHVVCRPQLRSRSYRKSNLQLINGIEAMSKWTNCLHCGGEIRAEAEFCRHCGSSDSDGWSDGAVNGLDEASGPDEFDYESYVASEFGDHAAVTSTPWLWRLIAVMLLIMFFSGFLFF